MYWLCSCDCLCFTINIQHFRIYFQVANVCNNCTVSWSWILKVNKKRCFGSCASFQWHHARIRINFFGKTPFSVSQIAEYVSTYYANAWIWSWLLLAQKLQQRVNKNKCTSVIEEAYIIMLAYRLQGLFILKQALQWMWICV